MKRNINIYKRKDGRWEGRIKLSTHSNPKYVSVYGKTYKETLQKFLEKKKSIELENEKSEYNRNVIFTDVAKVWFEEKKICLKLSTLGQYRLIFEKHILPRFGDMKISQITTDDIMNFADCLKDNGLKARTIQSIIELVNSIIKFAKNKPEIRVENIEKAELKAMSSVEVNNLVNFLNKNIDRSKLGVLFVLHTGIRIGELCALRWDDINLETNEVTVSKTIQRIKNISEPEGMKTQLLINDIEKRVIPIPNDFAETLKKYANNENGYFLSGTYKIIEPRTMMYRLSSYSKRAEISKVDFSQLRDTFALRVIELGVNINIVAEILGVDVKTMVKYILYTKISSNKFSEIQKLNQLQL